jgi:hypothetical protein
MFVKDKAFVWFVAAISAVAFLIGGCSQSARSDRMSPAVGSAPTSSAPPEIATISVTVYGDVGGFASHYYPLPQEDYDAALGDSIAKSELFAASATPESADFDVNVGLISLVAPKWSGTVTLETSWSVTLPNGGDEIARHMIRTETPSPFSKVREATEEAARQSIDSGLAWLQETLETPNKDD